MQIRQTLVMSRDHADVRKQWAESNVVEQVLFKRKPVQFLPRPTIEDDSSEV